ncbi:MAG: FtsX-like permease family protein [Candidatus Caccosoma sp.]|nr:FtsX-like permease family protein [Candidatus Caccosoma sp.]
MVKTYCKTIKRMLRQHFIRLCSLIGVILISIGFISGIGSPTDMIHDSIENYYKNQNVSDFIIKSKTGSFTDEQISITKLRYGEKNVHTGLSLDIQTDVKRSMRLYFLDFEEWSINVPELVGGTKVTDYNGNYVYAECSDNVIKGYQIGEKVEIDLKKALSLPIEYKISVTVQGIVKSPLTFGKDGEPSYNNPDNTETPDNMVKLSKLDLLDNILYLPSSLLPVQVNGDLYITLQDRNLFKSLSNDYKEYVEKEKVELTTLLGNDIKILTLYDNYSFKSILSSADKVRGIGNILMLIFIAVSLLVVLSSMMRLMEEERAQIACLKTIGYFPSMIVIKYILFALVALLVGCGVGFFVGYGVSWLMCYVFSYGYDMPPISIVVKPIYYFLSVGVISIITLVAIFILGMHMTDDSPANLLRQKPPKKGKRVILENIPFIWNKLSFKYKSSLRNVLRYKMRFFMMLVSVAVSTGLVFAGLALLDMCLFDDFGSPSIIGISIVVVVFAGLLTAVVINTLTTINISERNREIATLMVLGYLDHEVCGYIYREIYISTLIGILFGYPTGIGLATLIFKTIGFGTVSGVSWFMWLFTPLIVFGFTIIVTLLLRPKIVKTKMNESLKAID